MPLAQDKSKFQAWFEKAISFLFVNLVLVVLVFALGGLLLAVAWITMINPKH